MAPDRTGSSVLGSLHSELSQKLRLIMRCIVTTKDSLGKIASVKIKGLDQSLSKNRNSSASRKMSFEKQTLDKEFVSKAPLSKISSNSSERRTGLRLTSGGMNSDSRRIIHSTYKKSSRLYTHNKYKSNLRKNRLLKSKIKKEKKKRLESKDRGEPEENCPSQDTYPKNTQNKPTQTTIPIQQFWAYSSQYFRCITEDDLRHLAEDPNLVMPYIIPPLGKHYTEGWKEGDHQSKKSTPKKSTSDQAPTLDGEYAYVEKDGIIYPGNVGLNPLSERVMSSLVEEYIFNHPSTERIPPEREFIPAPAPLVEENAPNNELSQKFADLEERLRLELKHIGLIDTDDNDETEGDEIVEELRELQQQLRCQIATNNIHKKKLRNLALKWMAKQELDTLISINDKNIEKSYSRRFKYPRSKGRKRTHYDHYPSSEAVSELLKNRERIIKEVGSFLTLNIL